jgi:hypothetical protein
VHEADGLQITFWKYFQPDKGECQPAAVATSLHQLHQALDTYPAPLPRFEAELAAVAQAQWPCFK